MKIKFLGTGGNIGTPVWNCDCKTCRSADLKNKRMRASLFLTTDDNTNILIDFGPDLRQQLLQNNIRKIDYAFLTHTHGDHTHGFEQLSRQENIKILMTKEVLQEFEKNKGALEWFKKRNPSADIKNFDSITVDGIKITPIKLIHQKDYSKEPFPCVGFIFEDPKFRFAYLSDYNAISGDDNLLYNLDLIVSDANSWKDNGIGHAGIEENIQLYKKYKPRKLLLTHINHTVEHNESLKYCKAYGNIEPAYDGLELEI
ncbi:MAG: MBL fold metallo-hydrolase [Lactobacillaceae bacterium]|jgi:phosphoribosyl 1,2-cyclic phosphate phosphodiesterase|nr:MBL fold metallo-hydrolase [Lactobacillaceae bacterium]